MLGLRILLLVLVVTSVSGWWWGRRRRSRTDIHHHHTINCHCKGVRNAILDRLDKIEKKLGNRDVAEILDVDEDYPGFEDFAAHLDTKRDGTIDKQEFASAIRRALSSSSLESRNTCHCGRAVLDKFNSALL